MNSAWNTRRWTVLRWVVALGFSVLTACECGDGSGVSLATNGITLVEPSGPADQFERSVDLGAVRVGSLSIVRMLLRNDGRLPATISSARIESTSPEFTLRGAENAPELQPGQELILEARYVPQETGTDDATVTIDTTSPETPQYLVHIHAVAATTRVDVCTARDDNSEACARQQPDGKLVIDLGTVRPGQSAKRPFVVHNRGDAVMDMSGISPTPTTTSEFSIIPAPTRSSIPAGGTLAFEVQYAPADGGAEEGAFEVRSDDPNDPRFLVYVKASGLAPRLCVDPVSVDFGDVAPGTTARKTLGIVSCGLEPARVTELRLFTGDRNVFALPAPPSMPTEIAVGSRIDVELTYTPALMGIDEGYLTILSTVPGSERGRVPLRGRGAGCVLSAVPSSVDFGQVGNTTSSQRVVQLRNTGTSDCTVTEIRPPVAPFAVEQAPGLPLVIPAGQTESISVGVRNAAIGRRTGELVVLANTNGGQVVVPLLALGINTPPCDLQATPSAVTFAGAQTGQRSQQAVQLKNNGTGTCYLGAEMVPGSAPSITVALPSSGPFSTEIRSGASVNATVSFLPTSADLQRGTVRINYADDMIPPIQVPGFGPTIRRMDIPVEGGTLPPQLCISPAELDFGQVPAGGQSVLTATLTSCGQGALGIRGINLSPGSSADFSLETPPRVPQYLAPGQSVQVRVKYKPLSASADFGAVEVLNNDPAQRQAKIKLRANATNVCDRYLACAVDTLQFPTVEVGRSSSMSVVCRNAGTQDISVTGVQTSRNTSAEFRTGVGRTPITVVPGGTIRVEVTYTPTAPGNDTGTVVVQGNACVAVNVNLEAAGRAAAYPRCNPPLDFTPREKWTWSGGRTQSDSKNVGMTPIVLNLTDDNTDGRIDESDIPDVIFTSCRSGQCCERCFGASPEPKTMDLGGRGMVRAVNGRDGSELWNVTDAAYQVPATTQIAGGDIDGDNIPEIIAVKHHFRPGTGETGMEGKYATGTLLVFDNTGRLKFETESWTGSTQAVEQTGAPTLGDVDSDGLAEIVFERTIFRANGTKLADMVDTGNDGHGSHPALTDLDGDGRLEIVVGRHAFRADGTKFWSGPGSTNGSNMVLEIDGDNRPDVILRDMPTQFRVVDALTGRNKGGPFSWDPPRDSQGDPASICGAPMAAADLDGDRLPEIIIPSGDKLLAYKANGTLLWQQPISDYGGQCGAAGAAAFDFDGDGRFEAVYHDTDHLYVFRGFDGAKLYDAPRNSSTLWETPVVADVDNDGHADLIMTNENGILGIGSGAGVRVYSNQSNNWVSARRIWNQHAYHVSDVNENGSIPRVETPHWQSTNSWRANTALCRP